MSNSNQSKIQNLQKYKKFQKPNTDWKKREKEKEKHELVSSHGMVSIAYQNKI